MKRKNVYKLDNFVFEFLFLQKNSLIWAGFVLKKAVTKACLAEVPEDS